MVSKVFVASCSVGVTASVAVSVLAVELSIVVSVSVLVMEFSVAFSVTFCVIVKAVVSVVPLGSSPCRLKSVTGYLMTSIY